MNLILMKTENMYRTYSENAEFARKLEEAGVKFIGPTVDNL